MIAHQVEAVVLRTWPIHEADQIVSLFTRDFGKIKGVAKSAARSRRRFGGALEPMTHVRAHYAEKPSQELVRLDSFDILHSPLAEPVDYARATALAFFAEVLEQTLPDHDPHDVVFRLLLSVLEQTRVDHIWMPITYFALWTTRLMGWLPDLSRCLFCGTSLAGQPADHAARRPPPLDPARRGDAGGQPALHRARAGCERATERESRAELAPEALQHATERLRRSGERLGRP